MTTRYDILITYDDDSALFLADVPDLPGCYSQGETEEQAEINAREAIALHVQTLRELGKAIPRPSMHVLRAVDVVMA
jgi:antitoxin HicB